MLGLTFSVLEISFIDLILSGDNAVVIALATRTLEPAQRRAGIVVGTAISIALRVVETGTVGYLLNVPLLGLIAAALLLYVAVKLVLAVDDLQSPQVEAQDSLWSAIRLIVIADVVMSLDNVLGVASVAQGNIWLLIFGLLLSMPLLMFGSSALSSLIRRVPMLIPLCGGLLGWVAGEIAIKDPLVRHAVLAHAPSFRIVAPILGTIFVMSLARILDRHRAASQIETAASLHASGAGQLGDDRYH